MAVPSSEEDKGGHGRGRRARKPIPSGEAGLFRQERASPPDERLQPARVGGGLAGLRDRLPAGRGRVFDFPAQLRSAPLQGGQDRAQRPVRGGILRERRSPSAEARAEHPRRALRDRTTARAGHLTARFPASSHPARPLPSVWGGHDEKSVGVLDRISAGAVRCGGPRSSPDWFRGDDWGSMDGAVSTRTNRVLEAPPSGYSAAASPFCTRSKRGAKYSGSWAPEMA